MVTSARNDHKAMVKMLRGDPGLAKQKNFVSGYTALHWSAKHGNVEMARLLARDYLVDINQKTHGGYTPLHLARKFGHHAIFELLVNEFDADFSIRDNYGRKAHQHKLVVQEATIAVKYKL